MLVIQSQNSNLLPHAVVILFVQFVQQTLADLVNFTIDDQLGDEHSGKLPDYHNTYWEENEAFLPETSPPIPSSAFNNTWSTGWSLTPRNASPSEVSIEFTGEFI